MRTAKPQSSDTSFAFFLLPFALAHLRLRLLQTLGRVLPAPAPPAQLPATASILIIRPDHLGDVLLAAPAVGLLRRALPAARLSYLVGPWAEEAARRGPPVDDVLTCPFPGFTRQPKPSIVQPYQVLLRYAARLRGRFQAALVLRPDHWWGSLLAAAAGIPLRLGFAFPECAPFLTHALAWTEQLEVGRWRLDHDPSPILDGSTSLPPSASNLQQASVALVRRLLALAPAADPHLAARPERFAVSEAERAEARALLAESGLAADRPLVAIHPGSGARLKLWPAERWVAVGAALANRRGARVLISGTGDERALAERVAEGIGPAAVNLAGRTSLGQLAALFERTRLVLGPDSGPLHLAASVGVPTVRLFGPTDPRLFMPVDVPHQRALATLLPCRPCGALEQPPCGASMLPACLTGLSEDEVIATALRTLEEATGSSADLGTTGPLATPSEADG